MNFISELNRKAILSFERFPITLSWVVLGSFYLIGIYGVDDFDLIQQNESLNLVLALGVSWLIGSQFLSEALHHNTLNRFVFKLFVVLALGLFYYYLEFIEAETSDIGYGRWALLLLAGHVFVIFAPFIKSWHKHKFWNYLKSIIIALVRSGLYAVVLYVGLAIAISAMELLFDFNFNSYIYLQTLIFCLGIVNTFVYLSDFPKLDKLDIKVSFNKASEVLILYILMPLSLLYILIVYAYALKILIDWELPRGSVTYLISALSVLAFVIHIAIEPVRESHKSKFIQKFFPLYFYAILPLLALLFIALYKRISDYNFTELRYLGVVLAVWITVMLIYMIVSNKKALSLYAKSMFLLILLSTFGPLSAFKISINAQFSELGELMQKLENKPEKSFTAEEYNRFESIVKYLNNRNALAKTEAYFGFNPNEVFSEANTYKMPRKLVDTLDIKVLKSDLKSTNIYKNYVLRNFKPNYAVDVSDYNHFTELKLDYKIREDKALQLHFDDNNNITFRYYGEVLFETNMTSHLKTIAEKYNYLNEASQEEFTFRFKNEKGDFLIIFKEFRYNYQDEQIKILNAKAMLFYRTYDQLELP
ncbi:DUF4153 domain-containing protein [Flavobacteriaceae bacterium 14752]|uniref:DUF4153 domain-containing protein n=1 Tax=Mesohalobacter salilacus TaxID=2491711 RepID=UPI000F642A9C|nr:DUF4153 domain-containing protein [Flavobacteriaceae bacterium 14752]